MDKERPYGLTFIRDHSLREGSAVQKIPLSMASGMARVQTGHCRLRIAAGIRIIPKSEDKINK